MSGLLPDILTILVEEDRLPTAATVVRHPRLDHAQDLDPELQGLDRDRERGPGLVRDIAPGLARDLDRDRSRANAPGLRRENDHIPVREKDLVLDRGKGLILVQEKDQGLDLGGLDLGQEVKDLDLTPVKDLAVPLRGHFQGHSLDLDLEVEQEVDQDLEQDPDHLPYHVGEDLLHSWTNEELLGMFIKFKNKI